MAVIQDININVHGQPSEKRLQTFLRLSQNENGRSINFRVLGAPLPSGCTATFAGTKPDGNVYSTTGTVTGNFVIVQEDMQMTAIAGVWDAKLDIVNGLHNIMTAPIRVIVDADEVDPNAIASDSQLQGLVAEAKYYAEQARTEAYGSPLTAEIKAQMTDHKRAYVYTGSEPNMVAGNWYYWNGSAWTSGGVYNAVAVQTDKTLTVQDKPADGKATGDAINDLKEDLNALENVVEAIEPGISNDAKVALLACFQHVAWIDEHGQSYYDALEDALYASGKTLVSISATFNQGQNIVYTDDTLDSLKQYLTVTATYDDSSTATVVAYTLSGTLTEGTSTITVSYSGKTTTFNVTVTDFYNIWEWSVSSGNLTKINGGINPAQPTPTCLDISQKQESTRRSVVVERGKAPFYYHVNTGGDDYYEITSYYPIPIPKDANYYTVKGVPSGFYFYSQVFEYDPTSNSYPTMHADSRFAWTQQTGDTPIGHEIVGNNGNFFFGINLKDSSASDHTITTEPTNIIIEFDEV